MLVVFACRGPALVRPGRTAELSTDIGLSLHMPCAVGIDRCSTLPDGEAHHMLGLYGLVLYGG